jgi:hypothetical protein
MPRLLIVLAFAALSACAPATEKVNEGVTPAKLQADTATYFRTSAGNVRVGKMTKGVLGTSYQARVGRTLYNCKQFRAAITCEIAR